MKLLRYGEPGQERPGMLDEQGRLRDLSQHIADVGGAALSPASLAKLRALDSAALPLVEGQPRLGACVGGIGKFICIGLNYADHAAETGAAIPEEPVVFNKWTSAVVGPYDRVEIPRGSQKTDWEVELGVVIGLGGRYISEADAMRHVAGYCVINDVSEREYQIERGGTWDKGKGCDTFGPIGPWLVTADEIADPHSLNLWLEVDGKRYQDGNTSTMIFRIPQIVSYLSRFMSLQPGDFDRRQDRPVFQLGAVRHVVRRIVALQHAEHAAVTVAEQVADDERIGRVAAGLGDADVEQPIAGVGGGTGAVIAAVLFIGGADTRQLFVGGVARGQRGGLRFDQQAGLQQRKRRQLGVEIQLDVQFVVDLRPLVAAGLGHHRLLRRRQRRWRAHDHPVADLDVYQADHFQRDQRLAHRRAADLQLLGEIALRGQTAARRKFVIFDQTFELVSYLSVNSWVFQSGNRHF